MDFNYSVKNIIPKDDQDYSTIIKSENKIDLFSIEANKLLNRIKSIVESNIGRKLNVEKTDKIDNDFKKTLREMLIVNRNKLEGTYISELTYIYYALYNDTLDVYYDIKNKYSDIHYYMLDEMFYNNINDTGIAEWENYSNSAKEMLSNAYECNLENELLNILKINPNFSIPGIIEMHCTPLNEKYIDRMYFHEFMAKGYLKILFNLVGIQVVARSDFEVLVQALGKYNLEYAKELATINPNINFDNKILFSYREALKQNYSMEQIAFFTDENKNTIKKIVKNKFVKNKQDNDTIINKILKYYGELIDLKPDFVFYNDVVGDVVEIAIIAKLITDEIDFPANVYSQLSEDERRNLIKLFKKLLSTRISIKSKHKFLSEIEILKEKYLEPKQYKLTK